MDVAGFAKACQRKHSPVASAQAISSVCSLRIARSSKMQDARVAGSVLEAMDCRRGRPQLLLAVERHAMAQSCTLYYHTTVNDSPKACCRRQPHELQPRFYFYYAVLCISLEGLQPAVCCVVTCKAGSIRARERHVARPTGALLASMKARDLRRSAYAVAWVSSC